MTPERAEEIISEICWRSFTSMGLNENRPLASLSGVTLSEMLEARSIIEEQNRRQREKAGTVTLTVIPDDRLIAEVYAFENYEPDRRPIIRVGDKALAVVDIAMASP